MKSPLTQFILHYLGLPLYIFSSFTLHIYHFKQLGGMEYGTS
jgi:hypothetical protein